MATTATRQGRDLLGMDISDLRSLEFVSWVQIERDSIPTGFARVFLRWKGVGSTLFYGSNDALRCDLVVTAVRPRGDLGLTDNSAVLVQVEKHAGAHLVRIAGTERDVPAGDDPRAQGIDFVLSHCQLAAALG